MGSWLKDVQPAIPARCESDALNERWLGVNVLYLLEVDLDAAPGGQGQRLARNADDPARPEEFGKSGKCAGVRPASASLAFAPHRFRRTMRLADSSPNPARNTEGNFALFARRGNHPTLYLVHDEAVFRCVAGRFRVERRHLDADRRQQREVGVRGQLIKRLWRGVRVASASPSWMVNVLRRTAAALAWASLTLVSAIVLRRSFNSSVFFIRSELRVFLEFNQLALQLRKHWFQGRHLVGRGGLDRQWFPLRLSFHLAV